MWCFTRLWMLFWQRSCKNLANTSSSLRQQCLCCRKQRLLTCCDIFLVVCFMMYVECIYVTFVSVCSMCVGFVPTAACLQVCIVWHTLRCPLHVCPLSVAPQSALWTLSREWTHRNVVHMHTHRRTGSSLNWSSPYREVCVIHLNIGCQCSKSFYLWADVMMKAVAFLETIVQMPGFHQNNVTLTIYILCIYGVYIMLIPIYHCPI